MRKGIGEDQKGPHNFPGDIFDLFALTFFFINVFPRAYHPDSEWFLRLNPNAFRKPSSWMSDFIL